MCSACWRPRSSARRSRRTHTMHTIYHTMQGDGISLLKLWVRLPDLHRVRPHYVDSTASRPICEVKLRQAGLVVWFVRTCEVLVLYFIFLLPTRQCRIDFEFDPRACEVGLVTLPCLSSDARVFGLAPDGCAPLKGYRCNCLFEFQSEGAVLPWKWRHRPF